MLCEAIFVGVRHLNLFQHSSSDNKWLSIISHPPIRKKLSLIYFNYLHSLKRETEKKQRLASILQTVMAPNLKSPTILISVLLRQCPSVAPFPSSCRLPILHGANTHITDAHAKVLFKGKHLSGRTRSAAALHCKHLSSFPFLGVTLTLQPES